MAADRYDLTRSPETRTEFRLGQVLLLMQVGVELHIDRLDIDRLAYYEFFAANPFLMFEQNNHERTELILAGFDSRTLSYQSSSQRFANRRARLHHDLARLLSLGLLQVANVDARVTYALTDDGRVLADGLRALYADAYRTSARLVIRRLRSLSDARLQEQARSWLRAEALLIDLYSDAATSPDIEAALPDDLHKAQPTGDDRETNGAQRP